MSTQEMRRSERMNAMRVLLKKYNLEEDADKLGSQLQTIRDIGCINQEDVNSYKLKGSVAQYMDIFKQETGKYPASYNKRFFHGVWAIFGQILHGFLQRFRAFLEEQIKMEEEKLKETIKAKTTLVVKDLQDKTLEVPMCCPITKDLFKDPVISKVTGHSYEREYIEKWLVNHSFCPVTKIRMTSADLVHNRSLKDVVEAFKAQTLS